MRKILDMFSLVPAWAYAGAVAALVAMLLVQDVARHKAISAAAQARAELAEVRRGHAEELASAIQRARTTEAKLAADLMKEANELQSRLADRDQRVSDLVGRLHHHARPVRLCAAATGGASAAAGSDHGQPGAGLRGLDGDDLVVLDAKARVEHAQLATAARDVGETLKACRVLLRKSWQSAC